MKTTTEQTQNKLPLPYSVLMKVEKPARYIGKEINMIVKNPADVDVRFAFCFPDVYEVGMSHLGLQILYGFLNRRPDCYCERVFTPWIDMEQIMRREGYSLFSLETYSPLKDFDIVGFTLQYEMSYSNIVNMLDLAHIPLLSAHRGEDDPIVCAGGPCAYNPEPLAEIIDFFYIGEGEACLDEILDLYKANKREGGTRRRFLEKLLTVKGVYVPYFYDVSYHPDGTIAAFTPNHPAAPSIIEKVIAEDLESVYYPERQLVPLIEAVHNRVTLEVFRGCIRGCRFCQAGYVYRPVREKPATTLIEQAESLLAHSGHDEISLVSLSTGDYREFKDLAQGLIDRFAGDNVSLSLPSLRIDAFNLELMQKVQEVRKSSLTFAPEAGTQRMRDVINKNLTEEEILTGCRMAFDGGWARVKLYFMLGLPTETQEDLAGIGQLSEKIVEKYYELPKPMRARGLSVVLSTSCFVPKPFTPFQWEAQNSYEQFMEKQKIVKRSITRKQVRYNYHDAKLSVLEGVFARGDRRTGNALIRAWELGARFDGWSEHFRYGTWVSAFEDCGLSMAFYAERPRPYTEILPWDHIAIGVSKDFLIAENEKALHSQTTPDCRTECAACGAARFGGGVCYEK